MFTVNVLSLYMTCEIWIRTRLGRPMSMFTCSRTITSFIKPKHRRLLAFTNPVSPSESGLAGLQFCCAVTVTWKVAKVSTDSLAYCIQDSTIFPQNSNLHG